MTMKFETLQTHFDDGVFTISLCRPERMNAFNAQMMEDVLRVMDHVDRSDDVRAVVFTGTGRAFCAGAELPASGDMSQPESLAALGLDGERDSGGRIVLRLFDSLKPLVAACNGPAIGFGSTFQLGMDIRLASIEARYGFVFPRLGSVMEGCSSWFLPRLVGIQTALEWVGTGRIFDADEAQQRGLVRSVHKSEELLSVAKSLARAFAEGTSSVAVALNRQLMWKMLAAEHPLEAHRLESHGIYAMGSSSEVREGIQAFRQKRPPNFPLRVSTDMPDFFPWWITQKT